MITGADLKSIAIINGLTVSNGKVQPDENVYDEGEVKM